LFAIAGGEGAASTVRCAVALLPGPWSEKTWTELFFWPWAVAVTVIEKVQDVLAAKVAPARLMLLLPAGAGMVPPPQAPARPLGLATKSPPGRLSAKFRPVFPRVAAVTPNVSVVLLPTEISPAPNDLAIVGVFCPRICADTGLANINAISTPIRAAH